MKIKNLIYVLMIFSGLIMECKSQTIIWSNIQIDSIPIINNKNDSIINPLIYPDFTKNGLARNVTSTEYYSFQNEDFVKKTVQEYIDEKKLADNGSKAKRFAIIQNENEFILNEFLTETRYYYDEGCGIIKHIAITSENIRDDKIFCIFENHQALTSHSFKIQEIKDNQDKYIDPYKSITYLDKSDSLTFIYKGTYCYESFEYDGLGTIMPLFVNVTLGIKDLKNNHEVNLIRIPHNHGFNLKKIILADITSDNQKDVILETEDELCNYRMIYFSKIENGLTQYNFIGRMNVYCDCP